MPRGKKELEFNVYVRVKRPSCESSSLAVSALENCEIILVAFQPRGIPYVLYTVDPVNSGRIKVTNQSDDSQGCSYVVVSHASSLFIIKAIVRRSRRKQARMRIAE